MTRWTFSGPLHGRAAVALAVCVLFTAGPLRAADDSGRRDPTRWPEAAMAAASATAPAAGASAAGGTGGEAAGNPLQHRMVINGKPYLVERGWLRGVGDTLGGARIERITDTDVWLREGGELKKLPLYPNVQIRPSRGPAGQASERKEK